MDKYTSLFTSVMVGVLHRTRKPRPAFIARLLRLITDALTSSTDVSFVAACLVVAARLTARPDVVFESDFLVELICKLITPVVSDQLVGERLKLIILICRTQEKLQALPQQ